MYDPSAPFEIRRHLLPQALTGHELSRRRVEDLGNPTPTGGLLLRHPKFECSLNDANGSGWFIDLKSFAVQKADTSSFQSFVFVR